MLAHEVPVCVKEFKAGLARRYPAARLQTHFSDCFRSPAQVRVPHVVREQVRGKLPHFYNEPWVVQKEACVRYAEQKHLQGFPF